MTTKKDTKAGANTLLKCKLLGHQWQGDSLKRTCTRCGKTQMARFVGNQWVDVDVADQSAS
ncbi:MAG TPA: hypothetical protein DCS93_16885 [Microscillaceae bacterium]|nr:hypothetical protein [Microscillaceae bacterium]